MAYISETVEKENRPIPLDDIIPVELPNGNKLRSMQENTMEAEEVKTILELNEQTIQNCEGEINLLTGEYK